MSVCIPIPMYSSTWQPSLQIMSLTEIGLEHITSTTRWLTSVPHHKAVHVVYQCFRMNSGTTCACVNSVKYFHGNMFSCLNFNQTWDILSLPGMCFWLCGGREGERKGGGGQGWLWSVAVSMNGIRYSQRHLWCLSFPPSLPASSVCAQRHRLVSDKLRPHNLHCLNNLTSYCFGGNIGKKSTLTCLSSGILLSCFFLVARNTIWYGRCWSLPPRRTSVPMCLLSLPKDQGQRATRAGNMADLQGRFTLYSFLIEVRETGGVGEAQFIAQWRCFTSPSPLLMSILLAARGQI